MIDCLFCSFVSGKDQRVSIVYQDEVVLVMMSPRQANPGHVLIVPKQHIERFGQMPEAAGMQMFRIAMRMQRAIEKAGVKCEGTYLSLAEGEASFCAPHLCMDVVPRFRWDQYYVKAVIDRPYDDPDALLRWLAEERVRRSQVERLRALGDECSPEIVEELAVRIRDSYASIWG
jgi:histidine triad (HIT) family protein